MSTDNWNTMEWSELPRELRNDWRLLGALLLSIGASWTHLLGVYEGVHVAFLFTVLIGLGATLSMHTSSGHRKWYYRTRWANPAFATNWLLFPLFGEGGVLSNYPDFALYLTAVTGIYFIGTFATNLLLFWVYAYRRRNEADSDEEQSRALQSAVDKSLGNLQAGFSNLQRSISKESGDLQRAYQQVRSLLIKQSAELQRTRYALAADREELRKLRLLLDSPREQVELLTRKLRPNSTTREIASFIIGVVASLSATELHPIVKRLISDLLQ